MIQAHASAPTEHEWSQENAAMSPPNNLPDLRRRTRRPDRPPRRHRPHRGPRRALATGLQRPVGRPRAPRGEGRAHGLRRRVSLTRAPAGRADTAQGEAIRIAGRIDDELNRNGGANWDRAYRDLTDGPGRLLASGAPRPPPTWPRPASTRRSCAPAPRTTPRPTGSASSPWTGCGSTRAPPPTRSPTSAAERARTTARADCAPAARVRPSPRCADRGPRGATLRP